MKKLLNYKKLFALILSMIMVLSIIGCSPKIENNEESPVNTDTNASMFTAGDYIATSPGHNGDIKVRVSVSDSSIEEIEILEHSESPIISDQAIERIPKAIIDTQSLAVDVVSGATVSSNGVIAAVTEAIKLAGGDIAKLSIKKEQTKAIEEDVEYTTDVVVIGGGGAGLGAAVSAHQNGAEVILIEKMPRLGGNTILSGGALNAVDPGRQSKQGIEDSIDKHFTQTYEGGDKLGNEKLIKTLVENAYGGIQWLESLGMKFDDEVFTVLGGLWPRAHKPSSPLGTGFVEAYQKYIDSNDGIEIFLDTEATELISENGKIVGIKAKGLNKQVTIHANNGVIIATGGFSANSELRDLYNEDWPSLSNLKTTNHPGATGDGLILAEEVGANLIGLNKIQLLPMGDPETGSLSGNIEQGVEDRIFVNKTGERFVNEGERRDVMTQALMEQKDASMWVIVDSKMYPTKETTNNFNETIDELIAQNRAFKGDSLEELAEVIGVDKDKFIKTIEDFNKAVDKKESDEFGRTLFDKKIDTAPFYAGLRVPTVHHTMGGIEINEYCQVLDKNGDIITGLYAAGEVTGGIHGGNRLGGNALTDITIFGKIAGESAAIKR